MTIREPRGKAARHTDVTETLVAETVMGSIAAEQDSEAAVCELYSSNYQSLVRLAAILVRDAATAEEVVQDAFVAMHGAWIRLRDTDKALSYLRQSVVNRSRSVLRHRAVVDKYAPKPAPDAPSAEQGAISLLERSAVIAALRGLPARQREALVLRLLRGPVRGADRERNGDQQGGSEKSHGAWHVRAPQRAGAGVMTDPEAEYGERLRRALHAAADGVVPSGDGLERIRTRIAHEPAREGFGLLLGWLRSLAADVRSSMPDVRSVLPALKSVLPLIKSVLPLVKSALAPVKSALAPVKSALPPIKSALPPVKSALPPVKSALPPIKSALAPVRSTLPPIKSAAAAVGSIFVTLRSLVPERLRGSDGWLRPVIATAGAVLVAVIVTILAVPGLRQGVTASFGLTTPSAQSSQPSGQHGTGGLPAGTTGSATPPASTQPGASSTHTTQCPRGKLTTGGHSPVAKNPTACPTKSSAPAPIRTTSLPPPIQSVSPTPSTSPSPSPTPDPSPDPSPSPTDSSPGTGSSTGTTTQSTGSSATTTQTAQASATTTQTADQRRNGRVRRPHITTGHYR